MEVLRICLASLIVEDPRVVDICQVHVWGSRKLLGILRMAWIIKHSPPLTAYEKSIPALLFWQAARASPTGAGKAGCQILFAVDGITLCRFRPMVTLNQSLLPFGDRILPLYGQGKERWRLRVLAADTETRIHDRGFGHFSHAVRADDRSATAYRSILRMPW